MKNYFISWRNDSFLSRNGSIIAYDKAEHALLAFIGMLLTFTIYNRQGVQYFVLLWLIWNIIGLIWELYQLFIKKQLIQIKDLAANNIGIFLSAVLYF